MPIWVKYLICCIAAYLVGSINFAVIISKFRNKNIKTEGSGNPGTMNMLRSVGKLWGCLTFILDFFKGVAMSLVGLYVLGDGSIYSIASAFPVYLLGIITVFGHVFSIFLGFKGGKGVATAIGVFGVGNPIGMAVAFVLLMAYLYFFRVGFIGSLLVVYGLTISDSIIFRQDYKVAILLIILSLLITFTHRKNIIRFIRKEENSLALFKSDKTTKKEKVGADNTAPDTLSDNDTASNGSDIGTIGDNTVHHDNQTVDNTTDTATANDNDNDDSVASGEQPKDIAHN